MAITTRQAGDVTILAIRGKITIGVGEVELRNAVQQTLDSDVHQLILNLRDVSTIDSSGVGELVSAYTTASNRGCRLKLCELPPKVQDVLTITQLITIFETYDSEAEAVESFA